MSSREITITNFEETIESNDIVFLDFWAEWCGPCRNFAPVYEAAAVANPEIVFGKVDTEAQQELAAGFQITSIPTIMAFREGILLFSEPGALAAPQLDQLIEGIKHVDMVEVKKMVAEHEKRDGEPTPEKH